MRLILATSVFLIVALIAEPLLWDPLRAEYYAYRLGTIDGDQAKEVLRHLHEMGPEGEEVVLSMLNDSEPVKRRRAVVYLYRYKPEETESLLLNALQDDAHMVWTMAEGALYDLWSKSENEKANALYQQGINMQMQGAWDKAIPYFEQAIAKDPAFSECMHQIGHSYEKLGKFNKAINAYLETIELKPNHFAALNRLRVIYKHLGKDQLSAYFQEKTEAIFPHYAYPTHG